MSVRIDRVRPSVLRLTAHVADIATLISAARWVADGCRGQLSEEAIGQLRKVLADYDQTNLDNL
jgi:hypothetical protein